MILNEIDLNLVVCYWRRKKLMDSACCCRFSEEDRKWFMEAVQAQTVDVVQRMKEIKLLMDIPEESLGDCNLSPKDIEGIYLSIYDG